MKKYFRKNLLIIMVFCVHCLTGEYTNIANDNPFNDIICKSVTIRTIKDFNALHNCTIVIGHVRIVQMVFNHDLLNRTIPSNIEEISEYLLVYRVEGLDSLERLFPKLIVIRGVELLYDQYALVVLENRDLENIGLVSLLRVLRGSIRIESNPSLCFIYTINWVSILGNDTKQYYYVLKNNKSPNQCPLCYNNQDEMGSREVRHQHKCWSLGKYQQTTLDYIFMKKCYWQGVKNSCLTSCSDYDCQHCTNYVSNRGCKDTCTPPKYKLAYKRQCVTNCTNWGLIQIGLDCAEKCPKHYREVNTNGEITCSLYCSGNNVVRSIEDLEGLNDCTVLKGSLTIDLSEVDKPIIQHLEHSFRNLNIITGYLKIVNSPQITSFHFFKNLHTIQGLELIDNTYSLYVVNNNYLEELWLQNVRLLHGCVYFHFNPRLCYDKIINLKSNLKKCTQISVKDASTNSNGEMVVCGENLRPLSARISDYNSNAAIVEVDIIPYEDYTILIGYIYYYKEAPYRNVTRFDGRHGCGKDSWFTDIVLDKRRRHILKNLKPATQYAYFVRSMTTIDYLYQSEYASEIHYFETKPAKPGTVAKIYTHTLSTKELEIHWWPPRQITGIIEKYILQYEETNETIPTVSFNQIKEDFCQCPKLDTDSHVPTPHVNDFYSKEQFIYRDALSNFIFQKKRIYKQAPANIVAEDLEARFINIINEFKERNIRRQEEAKETYILPHPYPVCDQVEPNIQNQTENKCMPLERFVRGIELYGPRHSFTLRNLEPEKTYRISIRACVKDLPNGCGPEKVIFAETVSKSLETMLKNLTFRMM